MTDTDPSATPPPTLRLWPGVVAAGVLLFAWLVVPVLSPEAAIVGVVGGLLGAVAVAVWWTCFSRAAAVERWGAIGLVVLALGVTRLFLDESVATAGMGVLFFLYAVPTVSVALVVWAAATRNVPTKQRRVALVATVLVASGVWTLVRTGGITGTSDSDFAWRWTPTPEERLLAAAESEPMALPWSGQTAYDEPEWPGFRGHARDGVVAGVQVETNWSQSPPTLLWRRPIGPGWSSFAIHGDLLYTQEQRGEDEIVSSYRVSSGEPVWRHRDTARFWESNGGAGPRGTPTLHAGRVYALGATGILNALDAGDGSVVWSRDASADSGATIPGWGFSGSPLVVDDLVVVAVAGVLVAFDVDTGQPRWNAPGPAVGESYSSPHLVTLDGVEQIVLMHSLGAISVRADGMVLWEHAWPGAPIVQPASTADGEVLLSTAGSTGALGVRRLAVSQVAGEWSLEERWTSNRLKPYFNDFVVHDGYAYGFDGSILACLDLRDGSRAWKGGRYGHGQMVLLREQGLLLVLSEDGDLALVSATPDEFLEVARVPGIEGKTWNHPVVVGDLLLVRNGEEMGAFRLPLLPEPRQTQAHPVRRLRESF